MSDIDKFLGGPSVDDFLGVQPKSSTVRRAGDLAVSAAKGVVGAGEALVGLADIPTGGRAGKFLEQKAGFRPKEAKAAIEDFYTPEQKAANTAVQGADGFVDTLAAAVQNPSTIVQAGVESLPLMFGGAAIARGVKAGSAVARAAAGEGAVGAGSAAEQIRQETETGDLTAKQAALAAVSGAATGGISLGAGKVAQKLGIADIDTLLAGGSGGAKAVGAKDIAKGIGKSVFTEGVLEELPQSTQEQALQNLALDKPIGEGVGNAAAMGLLTGGLFGAVGGAASQYGNFVDGKKTTDLKPTDPAPELQPGPEGGVVTPGGQAFQDQDTFKQAWDAASEKEREDFISGAAKAEQSIDAMTQDAFDNMQSVRDADYRRKQPKGPSIDDFAPLSPELAMERMRQSEVTAQRALEKQLLDAEVAAGQKLPDTGAISRAVNAGVDSGAVPVVNGALAAATTPEQEAQRQAQLAEQQQAQQVTQARADAATKAKDLPSAAEGSAKALLDQSRQALEAGDTEGASKLIKQGISLQKQATQLREADTPKVEAKNANQPIPDSTPAGRAQTDGVVDGGNNVPAGADVAKTSSPATAPTAEGSALPPAQQVGQTEGGATEGAQTGKDGARTVEPATKAANKAKLEKTIAKRALAKTKEEKTDTGTHYAAGMSDFKAGKPRVLPSYFTEKTGKNPKDWYRGWDAANLAAPVAESRPATKPAKPADAVLGKNAKGETVYEDDKGIRYVVDGAFKLSESVDMIPTRQGMQTARSNPDDPRYTPVVDKTDTGQNDELDAEMQAYEQGLTAETRAEDKAKLSKSAERSQTANKTENTEKTPAESTSSQTSNSIQVSKNTIFTEDAAEKARAILRKKLYGTLNSGIDPEVMQAGISLAGYHIEKGARTFAAYAKAMIEDMGEGVRPYLKSWYLGVKFDPRSGQLEGMDSAADVELSVLENIENQADTVNSEKADDTTQQPRADNGNEESSDAARTDSAADSRPLDGRLAEADAGNAEGRKPTERAPRASRPRKDSGSGQPELFSFGETREDGGVRDRPTTTGSITPQEFTISDESGIGEGGLKKKYTDNIAAIKLVKELDATNMRATPEQQAVIAKYVGWGGIKGVFDPDNKQWGKQHAELKDLLTPEEFAAARRSMLDAHYTSIDVIDGMYAGLSHIGFRGGRILEPSMGIGNFIGRMPANIRSESMVVGVELDKLTGQLARHIYPNARIATPKGFEEVRLPSDSFDLAIGNPPFGQQSVFDPEHKDLSKFSIHNFFFAKSIDKLRPGGVLSMVVSRYFMDAEESQARDWIGERAKLLGAVRLPYTAFKTNANTEVVTDIIFLQKLAEGEESNIDQWSSTKRVTMGSNADGNIDKSINAYFVDNPQNVLGTPALSGSQYSANEYNVEPLDGELPDQIKEALSRILPAQSYEQGPAIRFDEQAQADVAVPDNLKNGSFFEKDGVIYAAVPGIQTEFTGRAVDALTPLNAERIRGMIKVRDSLRTLMRAELNDLSDAQLNNLRKKLNQEYDAFKAEHGFINAQANRRAFVDDPDLPLLESLEPDYDPGLKSTSKAVRENGETARPPKAGKADIFQKRVLAPETHIKNVTSAKDALLASLNVYGKIDTDYMAQIYTKPWDTIAAELTGKVYRDPAAGWVTSEEYLSGNVKSKLAHAETLVKMDQDLKPNVEALKAVQPVDLPVTKISVRLGSSWLPNDTVKQFIQETIGGKATVHYEKSLARWFVGLEGADRTATNITFGTNRVPAEEILVKVMNSQEILVKDNVGTSRETVYVVNEVETEAAKAKADDLKNKFKNWIWADADRAETLGRFWNDNYNTNRDRVYDGSHLTLPGSNPAITLRRHQKDAIWRALSDRVILLDHVVGAGKTFMMTGIAKEMRRLGIAKKPMFAVPNHLVRSWRDEIFRLYPSANVLVATEADFEKTNRRRLFGKIATGDWDAVVIGHSSVKKIGLPVESSMKVLKEQLDELSAAIETMKRERGDKSVVKDMERIKVTLETRMKKLNDKAGKKDDVVNFEEMGIDALFVDELHEFKNLFFYTQMSRVSGLGNPSGSGKAFDMFVKFRNLVDRFGERAVRVGATGTPVSNSLVEMYNMQRYMQYDELKRRSMHLLDGWAGNYGDIEQVYEVHPSGNGFRVATRFAKFVNLTSLMQMYRSFADTITMKDLKRQATEAGQKFPVPMVKGGRPQNVVVPRSDQQTKFFGIAEFARNEDGSIKFKAKGSPSDYVFEKDAKTEKWSYRKSDSNYGKGSFEGEAQARQSLADDLTTPVTGYNKGSILDQFENLRELTRESKGKINALSITNKARKAGLDYRLIDPSAADDLGSKINDAVSQIKRIYDKWSKDKGAQLVFCDLSVPASQVAKLALKERDVYVRNGEDLKKFKATSHNIAAVESVFYVGKTKDGYIAYDAMTGNKVNGVQGEKRSDVLDQLKENAEAGGLTWLQTVQGETETLTDEAIKEWRDENETSDSDEEEEDSVSLTDVLALAGNGAKFSVYDDVKAKLIKMGVPAEQVAFIHDANTSKQKAAIFKKVNAGAIRVLLGSTPKMGAGTNVQERLVGLHHLDAPWRPSDLEQREGRIVRQGNSLYARDPEGFEVELLRYATDRTYDTRMWQIIEHKANGIEQLRNAGADVNELDDIGGEAANAADMKAAASGNPLILEEIKLRNEVKSLEAQRNGWLNEKITINRDIREITNWLPDQIEKAKAKAAPLVSVRDKNTTEEFSMKVGDTEYAERKDATKAIAESIKGLAKAVGEVSTIANYRGFKVRAQLEGKSKSVGLTVWIEYGEFQRAVLFHDLADGDVSASGLVTRIDNAVNEIGEDVPRLEQQLEASKKRLPDLRASLDKPFEKEDRLNEARVKHGDVLRRLKKSGGAVEMTPAMKREFQAAVAKVNQGLKDSGFDIPAMSRLNPAKTKEGLPAYFNEDVVLAEPRFAQTQPQTGVRYAFDIVDHPKFKSLDKSKSAEIRREIAKVGSILLTFDENGQFKTFNNIQIYNQNRGQGWGSKTVGAIMETLPPGQVLTIEDIVPTAVGFWDKMGAKFPSSDGYMEAQFTPEQYWSAYEKRIAESNAKFFDEDGTGGTPPLSRQGNGAPAKLRSQGRSSVSGLSASQVREFVGKSLNRIVAPVQIVQSTAEASRLTGFDIPSDSAGVAHRGKIYLIADNITSKLDAERTFFHEAFHVGIRTKYAAATQGYENALRGIAMKNPNIRKAAGEWSLSFGKDAVDMRISYGMTPENAKAQVKLLAIEEALADMSGAVSDRINGLDTLLAAIQKLMRAMGLNTLADYFEGLSNAEALAMIADARKSTVARTESAMQPAMSRDRVYNNSREDLSNFNRYDAANDKPSQALRDAIKKFERETPGFQIDPLGNSRVIVTRLKKDDLVSSLKTLKEFGDTNNVAVGISSKTASYTDFSESSGFRAYIQRADDEIGGRVSYERDSNHFARIVGVYAPRSLKGEVRFSRKPSVNTLLKKYGYAPKYDFEVVRALNAGDRIFAFNEQDEKPIEITSVTSKEGIDEYPLDRLLILDKMAGVPDAPVLSRAPQTDTPAFREFVRQFVANQPIDKYTYDRELKDLKEEIINDWSNGNTNRQTGSFGPDEINAALRKENKAQYFDEDGDYTNEGNDRYTEIESSLAEKYARAELGEPQKKSVDLTDPANAANVLREYFDANGLEPNIVGGSGKSRSKYFTLGDGTEIRISDHELPDQYDQRANENIILPDDADKAMDVLAEVAERYVRNATPANSADQDQSASQGEMQERSVRAETSGSTEPAQINAGGGRGDITKNPAFRKWFGDSKVVNPDGTPMVVYHTTVAGSKITRFKRRMNDIGMHFGTKGQAEDRFILKSESDPYGPELRGIEHATIPVYLSIKWPLRLNDIGAFDSENLSFELERLNVATKDQINAAIRNNGNEGGKVAALRALIERKGYDGIVYKNTGETGGSAKYREARNAARDALIALQKARGKSLNAYDLVDQQTPEYKAYEAANKAYADHRNSNAEDSWIAFYPTQIKSAIGNNGSFNAKNPDIAFSRTGTLKDFIEGGDFKKKTTDAVGALFQSQRTFGAWHKTVGTQYHKAQVDADFRPVYESGQAYLRDMATIANNAADLAPDLLPKLQDSVRAALTKGAVSKADEQAVSNAVFKGTLDDTVYTSAADAGLTPEQFAFYKQARAAIDNSLDALVTSEAARLARKERGVFMAISAAKSRNDAMIIADFLNQEADLEPDPIAAKRKQALADSIIAKVDRINDLKQKGYAPLTRFGTHTVYVVENGIQRSFTLHESQVEANRTAKAMQELYPQAKVTQGILSEEAAKLFQGISPDTLELFGDVATVGPDGQEVFLGQTQVFQEYLKNAVNNRSALKRLIQRKGIEGYSKDVTRVLATFITSNARASSGNYHLGDMLEATNDIPKEKGDVKDEAVKLLQYVQNPVEEAAALRSFLFVQYLGGSVASAFVNMTQPLLQTFPYLSQWGPGKSAAELTKALGMVGKGAKITDERLAAALARAEKDGVVSPQEIHQLYAESARTFGNNRAIRRVLTVWGSLFGLAEQFNRRVTFIAAWNMAKDFTPADFQKAGVRSAFQFAEKAVDETQGIYNRGNRPDWARGALGATLFTFKQFSISYLELLKRLPNRERAIALGILVLAAGLQGLPGADDLDDVIDALMQSLGYSWNSKQEKQKALANILGRDGANFVMNGFSALPGVPLDVQGRLGLGNLIPGTAALKKSEVNKGRDVIEILGPAGGLVQDVVQGAGKLVTGDIGGAAQEFVPVAIRNAIKSVDMLQFGMYRDEKGRKVLDTDAYDAFIKGVGFQPRDVADASRTIRRVNQDVALVKVVESEIAEKMAQGYFEKDQQKILDARAQLMNWNQTNPGTRIRITPAQVQRRVREMNMTREQRIVKTAPKEIRADVKAQLQ